MFETEEIDGVGWSQTRLRAGYPCGPALNNNRSSFTACSAQHDTARRKHDSLPSDYCVRLDPSSSHQGLQTQLSGIRSVGTGDKATRESI
uniref:Uncharacterized protein n=1 Tax=Knipowitschia caucasica TaxID=637954 RepID=A0AAV2K9U1_KNICA